MDDDSLKMECEVCGGTDFYIEAGHYYCNECQTQSQLVQEHVFENDDEPVNKKSTKKIHRETSKKTEDLLTSWECYTYILKGLTQELVELGAQPELTVVVRCLWMKYLHKTEVFDVHSDSPPKLNILGPKKDMAILYNIKKRKRKRSRMSSTSTIHSARRQRSSKKRALIQSQYDELSLSQTLSQDSSLANDSLSSLKSGSETSDGSNTVNYNRFSNSELKLMMSRTHRRKHKKDLSGELTCHKIRARSFRTGFIKGPANLTSFTLYCLLYIGLLITGDQIQLGDMLRFLREGHLSFACFRHFFPEEISEKSLNISQRKEKLLSSSFFRQRCAKLIQFLNVSSYLNTPDMTMLCLRYCTELSLPQAIYDCTEKLILKTSPKMAFNKRSRTIPNYEGRAMSFIVFTLKLLFGLDGVTEYRFSQYADVLNSPKVGYQMFNFSNWLQFIGYRDLVVRRSHLPNALRDCDSLDSNMYLSYLKNQNINFKGTSRHIQTEVKDYLQVLDKILGKVDDDNFADELVYKPSLTPYVDYTKFLLDAGKVPCEDILRHSFAEDSLDLLLRPKSYLKIVGNSLVKNGGANDDLEIKELMYLYKTSIFAQRKSTKIVAVKISTDVDCDKFTHEYLESEKKEPLTTTDPNVLLYNWQKGYEKEFLINEKLLNEGDETEEVSDDLNLDVFYPEHYQPFERYWLNIPTNPIAHYVSKHDAINILSTFPYSFRMISKECQRILEQDASDFLSEFLVTELYLCEVTHYGCKNKKQKTRVNIDIKKAIANCCQKW